MPQSHRRYARDKTIYDNLGCFWRQLHRYGNPEAAMQLYLDNLDGAVRIAMISGGPRLLAVMTAIPSVEEIVMYDIFPGPLEATDAYIDDPGKYREKYQILQDEVDFLRGRGLHPRLDRSIVKLCLRDDFEPDGDFDGIMAEEVALHPTPENLREQSDHTLPILLDDADASLRSGGKFIFTTYPGVMEGDVLDNGLLDWYQRLVNDPKIELCDDGRWINIRMASDTLSDKSEKYRDKKNKFWLKDLSKARMYSYREVASLAEDRFKIIPGGNIPGGMFPFARRSYYTLWKKS